MVTGADTMKMGAKISLLAFVLLPLAASAQEPRVAAPGQVTLADQRSYVAARVGVAIPQHDDLEGYDNGFAFEAAVGFRPAPQFALELSAGRFAMSGSITDVVEGVVVTGKSEGSAIPVLATAKAFVPAGKSVEFYGLAGAGMYFVSADLSASAPGFGTFFKESDSDTTVGFHFGGGLSAQVAPRVTLGAELKYFLADATLFDEKGGLNSFILGAALGFGF